MVVRPVVLAAGRSSRFLDKKSKLLQLICGQPMICWTVGAALAVGRPIVVLGHQSLKIQSILEKKFPGKIDFVLQEEQLGTGDAFFTAANQCSIDESFLVLNGDAPTVTSYLLAEFMNKILAEKNRKDCALVCAKADNPSGYGRLIPSKNRIKIVEDKFCSAAEKKINLVNGGVYYFSARAVISGLESFFNNFCSSEVMITDFFNHVCSIGMDFLLFEVPFNNIAAVNTKEELLTVASIMNNF